MSDVMRCCFLDYQKVLLVFKALENAKAIRATIAATPSIYVSTRGRGSDRTVNRDLSLKLLRIFLRIQYMSGVRSLCPCLEYEAVDFVHGRTKQFIHALLRM